MKDVSIDLETLGIGNDAMILSIGAVKFDPRTGEFGEPFYALIDTLDTKHGGGSIDISTVHWWMNQSEEARNALFSPDMNDTRINLFQALAELQTFLGWDGEKTEVTLWARGNKDEAWLESAYKGLGLAVPFQYWQWKDQRTFCSDFKPFLPNRDERSVAHDALDDAAYQAECVMAVYSRLYATGALLPPAPAGLEEEPVLRELPTTKQEAEQRLTDLAAGSEQFQPGEAEAVVRALGK